MGGDEFLDRRHSPDGYGPALQSAVTSAPASPAWQGVSETMRSILRECAADSYCSCSSRNRYMQPAQPLDPYFTAIKMFGSWSGERGFPSAEDFPGGRLPLVLTNGKSSTINDDPN